jgi:hypothetical protein
VEIVHLYHCDHEKKGWSEQFNEQLTGLEYLHADVFLSRRKDRRSAIRKLRVAHHANSHVKTPFISLKNIKQFERKI